ncbi:methyltransferase domain-containing protein [Desulfobacula sp.]|uniref:methyltransferase domain-containing protein n=1 Tax=Desulfobacula sp. TaxID=2593537 RepID=UPI002625D257|nr:class I SAM-dependent methyltransferase [Desulfobacula sp.]
MKGLKHKITSQEIYKAIRAYLPQDHSNHQSLYPYLKQFFAQSPENIKVLDIGCGDGNSIKLFQKMAKNIEWYGVDIDNSPEVKQRVRKSAQFSNFNGVNLPYSDNSFDLLYCHQVLEHVRHPDALIADAFRVLKPNGLFVGAVSYLEPYHSYSIFNFTPYGIVRVFIDANFELKEIRPGTDASVLINRQLLNRSRLLHPIWKRSFLYGIINIIGRIFDLGHRERNFLKIQFSGHLVFLATRPGCIENSNRKK